MRVNYFVVLFGFVLLLFGCELEKASWPEPIRESKPWTRWWWPGNAVDHENISRELQEMADAGIGGVEITSIYGVRGEEGRFIEYLSPQFSKMLKFTVEEAEKLGMGVDLPPGSGWRCGGPFVPREKGLWSLKMHSFELARGEQLKINDDFEIVAAASFVDKQGNVTIPETNKPFYAPAEGKVYVAERIKNSDQVKRASDGGKGWAIDTFNEEITKWYLNEFWERLNLDEGMFRSFFHDSFEYSGDFTTNFMNEFSNRRGYDLTEFLHVLAGDCENTEIVARVKSDYRETLSDLVLESFIQPMTEWANRHGSLNRNQAHGSPANILDLYAACDIPETEIYKTGNSSGVHILVNKFASSAAHVTGKNLVSSESFTWLGEHWNVTPADMIRATNRLFLAGVNHLFFHGTCYSPADAEWPGWLFYASVQMNNRNPLWREMPALFKYIERSQSILQNARLQNDLLVYWPFYDFAATEGRLFNSTNIDRGDNSPWFINSAFADFVKKLTEAGYSFDYISDKQLLNSKLVSGKIETEGKALYHAVLLPEIKFIPVETMKKLAAFAADGGKVLFDSHLPVSVPGMFNLENREKELAEVASSVDIQKHVGNALRLLKQSGIKAEIPIEHNGFYYLKLRKESEDWYMLFNLSEKVLDDWIEIDSPAKQYLFYFPGTGEISRAEKRANSIRLQLPPERAVFVRCARNKTDAPAFNYADFDSVPIEITGEWKINFVEGGPVLPDNFTVEKLIPWTETENEELKRFSGTACYSIEFDWNRNFDSGILAFEQVKDCARIRLNGKELGTLLGPSFTLKADNLKIGKNLLEVEVTNVAANRIRDLDIRGVNWKKFYDINFISIENRIFDASEWSVKDAGLWGKVEIIPVKPD